MKDFITSKEITKKIRDKIKSENAETLLVTSTPIIPYYSVIENEYYLFVLPIVVNKDATEFVRPNEWYLLDIITGEVVNKFNISRRDYTKKPTNEIIIMENVLDNSKETRLKSYEMLDEIRQALIQKRKDSLKKIIMEYIPLISKMTLPGFVPYIKEATSEYRNSAIYFVANKKNIEPKIPDIKNEDKEEPVNEKLESNNENPDKDSKINNLEDLKKEFNVNINDKNDVLNKIDAIYSLLSEIKKMLNVIEENVENIQMENWDDIWQ